MIWSMLKPSLTKTFELVKVKCALESQLGETKAQNEQLLDDLQLCKDAKLKLEVKMQAMRYQFERELKAKEEHVEEKNRAFVKQLRNLVAGMDVDRNQRNAPVTAKKKLESDLKELNPIMQMHNMDALREVKEAKAGKEELKTSSKKIEREVEALEAEVNQLTEELAGWERARREDNNELNEKTTIWLADDSQQQVQHTLATDIVFSQSRNGVTSNARRNEDVLFALT
ncbi:myosin heavy chain, non-muscle-like [Stomoxys calcitrans]|uniref:myosin heavy chain, non-muscle-like n=1 Tax=Stomoxys calcitrans TaxID=35570 RepID=UPI0027E377D7|nr:myosin heavy chain, non-muscle-like [Stomoxys calcitrans]